MGSFSRWLIQTSGVESFRELYASGDFEGVYERPLSEVRPNISSEVIW